MIVLVGASASGKTQIAKLLFRYHRYKKCITTTTRQPREKELDGVDYHFLNKDTFNDLIRQDAFVEVTEYQNNYYGIQKKDVRPNGVVIVDPHGANALIKAFEHRVFIVFVFANELLREERMIKRGDELHLIKERLNQDKDLFSASKIERIDLSIDNTNKRLKDLAKIVREAYQNR